MPNCAVTWRTTQMIDSLDDALGALESHGEPGLSELRAALCEVIGGFDSGARVIDQQRLKRRVYRLRIETNDGVRSLVLKRIAPGVAQRNQQLVEYWLPALGLDEIGPILLGVAAERSGRYVWHIYDDLGDYTLHASAFDRGKVKAAVTVIAQLHTRSARHPLLAQCRLFGNDLGMHFYTANMQDAIRILESRQLAAAARSPERIALRDRLLALLYQRLDERRDREQALVDLGGPEALLHGDLWTANILVCPGEEAAHVRLIDWDHVGVGPVSYDLSTLLTRFPSPYRHWILRCYRNSVGWRLPSVADLNLLFATADWARWASCLIEPALGATEGQHVEWAFEALADVERWSDQITPILPPEDDQINSQIPSFESMACAQEGRSDEVSHRQRG